MGGHGRITTEGPRAQPAAARGGGEDARLFDLWVDRHAAELYAYAYRATGDRAIAEDLVQETYFEVWKHRGPLRGIGQPRAWLFVILRRRYARLRRHERRRPVFAALPDAPDAPAGGPRADGTPVEDRDALQAGLDAMAELYRLPLLLVFLEGLTCAQAAARLDVPLGTVLSRIHRGKAQLRDAMGERPAAARAPAHADGRRDGWPDDGLGHRPRLRIGGG